MVGKSENYHESGLPSSAKTSNIMKQIPPDGNAPSPSVWKTDLLTCTTWGQIFCIRVHEVRLELTTPSSVAKCSIHWAIRAFVVVLPCHYSGVERKSLHSQWPTWTTIHLTSARQNTEERTRTFTGFNSNNVLSVACLANSTTSALRGGFPPQQMIESSKYE